MINTKNIFSMLVCINLKPIPKESYASTCDIGSKQTLETLTGPLSLPPSHVQIVINIERELRDTNLHKKHIHIPFFPDPCRLAISRERMWTASQAPLYATCFSRWEIKPN